MSGSGGELQVAPSSQHARHKLHKSTSSISKHHHHPHLHHRDKDDKGDKSAGSSLQPSSAFDGIKSESLTPSGSHSASRRTSIFGSADDTPDGMGKQLGRRHVKEGQVKAERQKSLLRATELRKSLLDLNTSSNNATSRLDNTYYSILEKLSVLNGTITSLKELAEMARKLNDDFVEESAEATKDIETQLDGFTDFRGQEQKIGDLEVRIKKGREKAYSLGDRVEVVRQKIERWERVEGEWQQRTRKRLKMLWAVTAVVLLILVGLVVFQYSPARTHGPGVLRGFNFSNLTINMTDMEMRLGNETLRLKRSAVDALEMLRREPEDEVEEDPRLRAFDEL